MTSTQMTHTPFTQLLQNWEADFSAPVSELRRIRANYLEQQQRFASPEELNLRIGIMGQVKAGKSTFLNALLFDGKPILPQAATPKTANLTRISYGEQWQLVVDYYSPKNWDELRRTAQAAEAKMQAAARAAEQTSTKKKGGDVLSDLKHATKAAVKGMKKMLAPAPAPAALDGRSKAACELLALAQKNLPQEEIDSLLAKGRETITVGSLDELLTRMNDYVGNNGRYTPLVEMTHLLMPLPELQGFDVVDTPGMNDPVQSRTEKTKEEMQHCDVVFFLSRTSQFLDEKDMDLLVQQIPGGGVPRIVLVGGQLDSTMLEVGWDRDSLQEALAGVRASLAKRATTNIQPHVQRYEMDANLAGRAGALRSMMAQPLILASTFAHGFATWPRAQWEQDKAMSHAYEQINNMARKSWGLPELSREQWLEIAGFAPLRAAYEHEKQRKEQTLQEKKQNLAANTRQSLTEQLDDWRKNVAGKIDTLRDSDLKTLQAAQATMASQLQGISSALESILGEALEHAQQQAEALRQDLNADLQRGAELRTRTKTEKYQESRKISTTRWYKPWTWFDDDETVWETYTRSHEYIAVADAIESATSYERRTAQSIEHAFNTLLDKRALIRRLRQELEKVMESEDSTASLERSFLKSALDNALKQLQWPPFEMPRTNAQRVRQSIAQHFAKEQDGGFFGSSSADLPDEEVRDSSDRKRLQKALGEVRRDMYQRLLGSFDALCAIVFAALKQVQTSLHATLSASLQQALDQAKHDFDNKEQQLVRYMTLHQTLHAMQQDLDALLTV